MAAAQHNGVEDTKDVEYIQHDEDAKEVVMALAGGAKGLSKSADVAMRLFENHDFNMEVDPVEQKKIVRKMDWFIIPLIAVNCES